MMISKVVLRALAIFVGSAALAFAQTAQPLQLEKTIELPDVQGRIDHLSIDVKGQRLFVSALGNNTVEIIDLKAGKPRQYHLWLAGASGSALCTDCKSYIRGQ
jgi:hypothetical protein